MGLEPTTFCMASASSRSPPCAPVRSNRLFAGLPSKQANATEPEPTPNLAIPATESGSEPGLFELPCDPLPTLSEEAGADLRRDAFTTVWTVQLAGHRRRYAFVLRSP
jgi:hypothetical protein